MSIKETIASIEKSNQPKNIINGQPSYSNKNIAHDQVVNSLEKVLKDMEKMREPAKPTDTSAPKKV